MSSTVDSLIAELNKIETVRIKKTTNGEVKILDDKTNENKTICRLINIHFKEFFDDIYIPFDFFRKDDWKINKVLYNNEDILFHNKTYLPEEDEPRFYEVFNKYIAVLEEILTPNNKLYCFLKRWTDTTQVKWKPNHSESCLRTLLIDRTYQSISPAYITNIYCEISKRYQDESDKIKPELEKHLNQIISDTEKEIEIFKKNYDEIISMYVYEYPFDMQDKNLYDLAFINSILLEILNVSEKLIDLHIYTIHPIVNNVIEYYTPIDVINQYDPSDYGKRRICVV